MYEADSGLPLAGVSVVMDGFEVEGDPFAGTTETDARGRYVLQAKAGAARLRFTRSGYTASERAVAIAADQPAEVIDARLTRRSVKALVVEPALGKTIADGGASLVVAPGAIATTTTLAVTPIAQQGLQGLLPAGWSPVAPAPAFVSEPAPPAGGLRTSV